MPILRFCRILAVVATFIGFAPAAFAGPPLICHPFVVDSASPLLPWAAGREWRLPHPDYDVASLTADTLALLSVDAPIPSRMENLRRATIYAGAGVMVIGRKGAQNIRNVVINGNLFRGAMPVKIKYAPGVLDSDICQNRYMIRPEQPRDLATVGAQAAEITVTASCGDPGLRTRQ